MSPRGQPNERIFSTWAPGRVNLIGEHTDYSAGLVLPAAIDRGIRVDVRSEASTIDLDSELFGPADSVAADGSGSRAEGWARYAQAVALELAGKGRRPIGIRATVASTLPPRAGLSSSAALEVALALALCTVSGLELDPMELAALCRRAEFRAVGVPCGMLDPAASILGQEGHAVLLDCGTLSHQLVAIPEAVSLLVVDSGVERSLEHTGYAERKSELEQALALVGSNTSTAIRSSDLAALEGVGFGGSVLALAERTRAKEIASAIVSAPSAFCSGPTRVLEVRPSHGARVHLEAG